MIHTKTINVTSASPVSLIPSSRTSWDYVEIINPSANVLRVGTGLDGNGDLVDYYSIPASGSLKLSGKYIGGAAFYGQNATADADAEIIYGNEAETSVSGNPSVTIKRIEVTQASSMSLIPSKDEGYSYLNINNLGGNSVNVGFSRDDTLALVDFFVIANSASKEIDSPVIGKSDIFAQANVADNYVEVIYG